MENKSNSLNKIKRQQREKVLRFSIRKYSFGAASVAVAALMFLGARVASADSVVENTSSSTAGAASPKNEAESPLGITASTENKVEVANNSLENKESAIVENSGDTVDKSQLRTVVEELNSLLSAKLNLDDSVLSSVKERVQKGQVLLDKADAVQKDINELKELLSTDLAILSTAVKESSEVRESNTETEAENPVSESSSEVRTSEENQTVSAKKDSLKVSVDQLQAPVLELPEHETSKDVLEKANELIGLAQGVLENTTVSLNDVEDMKKRVKRMARGTQFRAYTATSSSGSLKNVKYFASVDKNTNGGSYLRNDDPEFTEKKTVIKAKYEQNSSGKWMVYDVYFNNNGVAMVERSYSQHYYFQPPFNIMDSSNKVENLTFTRYRNLDGNPDRKLSDGGSGFQKVGETATISYPWVQRTNVFPGDRRSTYDPQGVSRANQKWQVFKHNQDDLYLDKIVKRTDGSYTGRVSYTLGLEVGRTDLDYAIHMTARVKLKDNVTETEAANGNVYAASVTTGPTTNQSYIVGSQGTSLQAKPDASLYPIKGKEITKIVGESLGDVSNPVSSGFVVRNNDTKDFPGGMRWNWTNEQPNTSAAGIFQYNVTATYSDNSSNSTTATLKVKPIKPTITANDVVHKKGLTNQTITVNVGAGVKTGSTVTLYSDGKVIGTGKTNGTTARITVEGPLTGSPITAETTVNNNGTVKSDRSNPVTPTDAPDTQPPTLTVTPAEQTVKVGEKILFNVNGQDDTKVNLNFSDIFKKYADHLFTQKTNYSVNTDKQKTLSINLGAAKETDIGEKTVTFKATDDAGHETVKTVKVKVVPATKENATHNPTATELRVGINHQLTDDQIKAKVAGYPTNATLVVEEKPETNTTGAKTAKVKVIYSDKSEDQVDVPIIVRDTTPPKIYWAKDDGSKVELGKTHEQGQSIVIPLYRGDAVNTRLITTDA